MVRNIYTEFYLKMYPLIITKYYTCNASKMIHFTLTFQNMHAGK